MAGLPQTTALALDVKSPDLDQHVASHDVVISLVPFIHHADVIRSAIRGKTHVVVTSYVSPAMRELDTAAKEAGITVLNEVGVDPGVDHLYAVKAIGEIHEKGGQVSPVSERVGDCLLTMGTGSRIPLVLWRTSRSRGCRQSTQVQGKY